MSFKNIREVCICVFLSLGVHMWQCAHLQTELNWLWMYMFATLSCQSICECVSLSANKLSPACGPNHRKVFKTKLYVFKLLLEYLFIMWIPNSNSTWNEASFDWSSFVMLFRGKIFVYPCCVFIGTNVFEFWVTCDFS